MSEIYKTKDKKKNNLWKWVKSIKLKAKIKLKMSEIYKTKVKKTLQKYHTLADKVVSKEREDALKNSDITRHV